MKETVYEHLQGSYTFTVTSAERSVITQIYRLKEARPEEVEIVAENPDGSVMAHMPFEWMRIVPKRRDTLTDEQREARSERLRAYNKER